METLSAEETAHDGGIVEVTEDGELRVAVVAVTGRRKRGQSPFLL